MSKKCFCALLLFFIVASLQAGDLRRIKKKFENQDWDKTEQLIKKSIKAESINPGAKYYYSRLFLEPAFSRINLDSARILVFEALADFEKSSADILEELADESVTENDIIQLHDSISNLSFERAKERNSVSDWNEFLNQFPDYANRHIAIDARDKLLYGQLLRTLSIGSARDFIETYPASIYMERAKNKLDSMLVLKHRNSESRQDLVQFIRENPQSEYVPEALDHLLPLSTISGEKTDFIEFIEDYPKTATARKAIEILFHLDTENGVSSNNLYLDYHLKSDSLRQEIKNKSMFFFPVFEKTFQLVSPSGRSVETGLTSLDQDLICVGVNSDVLTGLTNQESRIINLEGKTMFKANLLKDLGYGYLLIEEGDKKSLVHKAGHRILNNIQDAELLNGAFIKVKQDKWGLYSLLGLKVADHRFDNIFLEGNFWFFEKNEMFAITRGADIAASYPEGLFLEFKFEDYELITDDKLIGFRDDRECLIKSDGSFIVPWGVHQIFPGDFKEYIKDQRGYAFFDNSDRFDYIEVNSGFTVQKISADQWSLFANKENWMLPLRDSLSLINNYCALLTGDERTLFFTNQNQLKLTPNQQVLSLSPGHPFILIKDEVSAIVNKDGTRIFSGNFDDIKLLSDTLFSVSFRKKFGVLSTSGNQLLPIEYDFISLNDHILTTLKRNRIGMFDLTNNVLIEPKYEAKFVPFGPYFKTSLSGKYGLIDAEETEVLPFEYDELRYWTDSLVWAKTEGAYRLINLTDLGTEMEVTLLSDFPSTVGETVKFYDTRGFGLRNNELGLILEPTFSEIRMLGTPEQGVIIGEQALPQADYRVLSYFDFRGRRIFSQAYRSEDYELLFCDD